MESKWPMIKLEEVLTERTEKPDLDKILTGEIPIVAKISFNTGKIELREETKTKTNMILIKPGDLVISGINAAKGAIAIYGDENTKPAAATIHYSSYEINKKRTDLLYLWYFFRSEAFRKILISNLPNGIKTEVKPKKLLPLEIPLPSLDEQKRIVARIESLMTRIEEARRLRAEGVKEGEEIIETQLENIFFMNNEWKKIQFGNSSYFKVNPSKIEIKDFDANMEVSFIPMKKVDPLKGEIVGFEKKRLFEVKKGYTYFKEGDVLFAKITPCMENGNIAIAKKLMNKIGFGSTEFHVIRVLKEALPEWVYYLFRTKKFREIAERNMTGTAGQRRVPKKFVENFQIPLPPLDVQRRIVAYLDSLQTKVNELKRLQAETEKEMEELIPSILDKAFKGEL